MPLKIKIPVKIGSHLTNVCINDKTQTMNCKEFIQQALIQCNLNKAASEYLNTYALFERSRGIELMINSNECIYNLWLNKWCNFFESNNNCINNELQLIIKKYKTSEQFLKLIEKNQHRIHRVFELTREKSLQNVNNEVEYDHLKRNYNQINEFLSVTQTKINKKQMKLQNKLSMVKSQAKKKTSFESTAINSSYFDNLTANSDKSTTITDDSTKTTKNLIKNSQQQTKKSTNFKKQLIKKILFKTDKHAKKLIQTINTSFKGKTSNQSKFVENERVNNEYSVVHYYEEIKDISI